MRDMAQPSHCTEEARREWMCVVHMENSWNTRSLQLRVTFTIITVALKQLTFYFYLVSKATELER